jgi:hypothetical protein
MPFFSRSNNKESEKTPQNGPEALNKSLPSNPQNSGNTLAPQQQSPNTSGSLSLGNEQSGIEVSFDGQNADQLEGSVGLFQGVKNIFGAKDTFSKVQQTLELYQEETIPDKKEMKRLEAIHLGEQFLRENNNAQKLKDANTLKKYQSVERIVEKLQKEHIAVDKLDKKVTVGAKLSAFFTGTESTFSLIDKAYSTYLNLSNKPVNTILGLIQVLSAGADLVGLMNTWEEKHGKETSKEAMSKKNSIKTIRANLGAMSILIKATEYLSIQASGITIDCFNMARESVMIPVVRLDVNLGEDKKFQAEANNVFLSRSGAVLSNARFSYTGEMQFADLITISNINGSINSVGKDQYDFGLAGTLAVDTGDSNVAQISTSGKASALYHGASLSSEVVIEDGHISLVVGNDFIMELNGLSYQEGVLIAEQTSLIFQYNENEFTGAVSALNLTHDAVDWNEAIVAYNGRIGIGDVVGVTNATGTVKGNAEQHAVELSGEVDLSLLSGNIGSVRAAGRVNLFNNGIGTPMKTTLTDGALEGKIANILDVKAEGIGYSEAAGLTAASASLSAELGVVGKVEGEASGLTIQNGVDWEEGSLKSEELTAGPISAKQVVGTVQGSSGANAMALEGILSLNLPGITASGKVQMSNEGIGTPMKTTLTDGALEGKIANILDVKAEGIGYSEAAGLTAASASLSAELGVVGKVEGEASGLTIQNGVDWEEGSLKSEELTAGPISAKQVVGTVQGSSGANAMALEGILSLNLPGITASGKVQMSNEGIGTPMKTTLTDGALEGKIANILDVKAEGIGYSEAAGLTAAAASLSAELGVLGKVEGEVREVSLNNNGVDWREASLETEKQIGFENIATISNLSGHILGSSGNYAKVFTGDVRFSPKVEGLGSIEAAGTIEAEQNSNAAPWNFAITNGSLQADLFGFMHIEESNLGYRDGEITLESPSITLSGNVPDVLSGFSVKGSEIVIGNGRIDWANIEVGLGKTFEPGHGLSAKLPNIILYGSAGNYNIEFRDAEASLSVGDAVSAQGGISMRYDRLNNQLEIMSAELNLSGKSPEIPGHIPGIWPFNLNFIFSLIPAGIPAEAGIGLYANGSVSAGLEGKVRYDESTPGVWYLTGRPNLAGKIAFGVKASAGMGSQLLIYLGVYLAAEAEATANGTVDLSTEIVMNEQNFGLSMEQTKATYEIEADLRALLKGGVEARALYFFGATLYEVIFKEWHIGHTSMGGELSLSDGKTTQNNATGVFSGNKNAMPDPAKSGSIRLQTKASSNALHALAKAQEILGNNDNSAEIRAFLGTDGVAKEQEFILIKQKVVQSFQDSIKEVLKAKDLAEKELKDQRGPVEAEISKLNKKLAVMKKEGKAQIAGDWFGTISQEEIEAKIVAKRTELSRFDILEARAINARKELNEIRETYGNLQQLLMSKSSDLTETNLTQDVLNKSEMLAGMY